VTRQEKEAWSNFGYAMIFGAINWLVSLPRMWQGQPLAVQVVVLIIAFGSMCGNLYFLYLSLRSVYKSHTKKEDK